MGAWGYTVFDDDTAYDALYDLQKSSDMIKDINQYSDHVLNADYIDYDAGHYVLVSATIMDRVLNGITYRCDDESYSEWIATLTDRNFSSVIEKVILALDAVLSDRSELKELWEENEGLYDLWREDKIAIKNRLLHIQCEDPI